MSGEGLWDGEDTLLTEVADEVARDMAFGEIFVDDEVAVDVAVLAHETRYSNLSRIRSLRHCR